MPTFEFVCQTCGEPSKKYRPEDQPPKYCSTACMIRGMAGKSRKPIKWPITPEIHEAIEKVYRRDTGNGQVKALAKRLNYPRWVITRYAIKQGLIAKQPKEPNWSEPELKILEHFSHLHPKRIQLRLKKAGFNRSEIGIVLKRKRMRFLQNLSGMSSRSAAQCLGVDDHFILRAIRTGKLKAKKRGTERIEAQGGDMWFIKEKYLRDYILENLNEIDIRKVDKFYFVDLLANGNNPSYL